jgi:hypothetical protein
MHSDKTDRFFTRLLSHPRKRLRHCVRTFAGAQAVSAREPKAGAREHFQARRKFIGRLKTLPTVMLRFDNLTQVCKICFFLAGH